MEKGSASKVKGSDGGEELSTLGLVEVIVSSEREGLSSGSQGIGVGEREQVKLNPKPYLRVVHNNGNQEKETGAQSLITGVECRMEKPVSRKPVMEWIRKPGNVNQKSPQPPVPAGAIAVDSASPSKVNDVGDSIHDHWQMAEGKLCIKHKVMPIGHDNQQKVVTQANRFGGLTEDVGMLDCSEAPAGNSFMDSLAHDPGGLECPQSE
ncbi:hypothetical protein Dimus_001254 [Dionaea muscipula]